MNWRKRVVQAVLVANVVWVAACLPFPEERVPFFQQARVCNDPSMLALATDLDQLEWQIDQYGSVVAKQPDVWGQARLTSHRQEFETELAKELGNFSIKLSGSLQRTDQAYLASAMALSAALPPGLAPIAGLNPKDDVIVTSRTTNITEAADPAKGTPAKQVSQVESLPPPKLAPQNLGDPKVLVPDAAVAVPRETLLPKPLPIAGQEQGVTLEPTLYLDQKVRYLQHLGELRRINEGDDTADSPGYGLALIRIPVSVLPGTQTALGHGAEVTFTLSPYLSDELLPMTFRNLVMNDLAEQLGFPLTKVINDPTLAPYLAVDRVRETQRKIEDELATIDAVFARHAKEADAAAAKGDWSALQKMPSGPQKIVLLHPSELMALSQLNGEEKKRQMTAAVKEGLHQQCEAEKEQKKAFLKQHAAERIRAELESSIKNVVITPLSNRRARLPFPPSQAMDLYGPEYIYRIGYATYQAFAKEMAIRGAIHLPDVQAFLQEELNAAHRLLASPTHAALWDFCTPALAEAITARRLDIIEQVRNEFHCRLRNQLLGLTPAKIDEAVEFSITPALAWAIIVDSALLNARLVEDMRQTAIMKNCPQCNLGWLAFYLPQPPTEARCAFHEYVRCRWPVHVFALDPITQDQNVADGAKLRREMQLALALGFISGNISAQNMTRYARRLEIDSETISLNRTIVAFGHGPSTFGWRFFPRFQTPEPDSNCAAWWQTCFGKKDKPNCVGHRLEPGMRECVALVIMPSFVPHACLEVQSNWFCLQCPEQKVPSHRENLRVDALVKGIQNCAGQVGDQQNFRDGAYSRLLVRAQQLEARLPNQTLQVQVPYENTLGGFEMFNTGITDLTPELVGFYGQPGILGERETVLFLMGDHFSVNHTKAIAGGQSIKVELISRQVLKATIPPGCAAVNGKVDVHVATPYGVSRALEVPLILGKPIEKPATPATTAAPTANPIQPATASVPAPVSTKPAK